MKPPFVVRVTDPSGRERRVTGNVTTISTANFDDGFGTMAGVIDWRLDDGRHVKEQIKDFVDLDGLIYPRI